MRGVMAEVPEHILEWRKRTGIYQRDEMWEGVLHMSPEPDCVGAGFAALSPPDDSRGEDGAGAGAGGPLMVILIGAAVSV